MSSGEEEYLWFLFLVEAAAHRDQATAAALLVAARCWHPQSQGNSDYCLFSIDFYLLFQQEVCGIVCSLLNIFMRY